MNDKPLFEKFYIEVSYNPLVQTHNNEESYKERRSAIMWEKSYIASVEMMCNFPRCKKAKIAISMIVNDTVHLHPLFDYNGQAKITRKKYNDMVMSCPVVVGRLDRVEVELTEGVISACRHDCLLPTWEGEK